VSRATGVKGCSAAFPSSEICITVYITFITDTYSHCIVGYNFAESLEAVESIKTLQMALSALGAESHLNFIHHSDRGLQYCSAAYVKLLQDNHIQISMTE